VSEYTHNDDVADLLHAKDREIQDLADIATQLERRITELQAEITRVESAYSRGL
jgi:uncharacterized small protein (DUF1192 family)